MPRQQTYGKRSRLIYDPLAAPAPASSPEQISSGQQEKKTQPSRQRSRQALGERNLNEVSKTCECQELRSTPPRRKRSTKTKKEDQDNVENECSNPQSSTTIGDSNESGVSEEEVQCLPPDQTEIATFKSSKPKRAPGRQRRPRPTAIAKSVGAEASLKATQPAEKNPHSPRAPPPQPLRESKEQPRRSSSRQSPSLPSAPDLSDPYQNHCSQLLAQSLHPLTDFQTWTSQLSEHFQVHKIAEASFGEVYRLSLLIPDPTFAHGDESVFKIIALTPPTSTLPADKRKRNACLRRAEAMSAPAAVANEVRLLLRMSDIPGFTNFRDVRVLQGRPGPAFVHAFRAFDRAQRARGKDGTCFPDPGKPRSYADAQLWAVIEMQDAGTDLERSVEQGACRAIPVVWDVFWQVVLSIAKGEEEAAFEHRDLHMGNVCVRARATGAIAAGETADGEPQTRKGKLHFSGLETTIIDYTLSRARMSARDDGATDGGAGGEEDDIAYHDLASDPAVFEGDATEEYQYDIYRFMRSALFLDRPLAPYADTTPETTGRSWRQYHPQTNLVWLHLVLCKLLEQIDWPSADTQRPGARRQKGRKRADETTVQRDLAFEQALRQTATLLDPANIGVEHGIASAGDLVHLAIAEGWLDIEDVVGEELGDDEDVIETLQQLHLS